MTGARFLAVALAIGVLGCDWDSLGKNRSCARCADLEAETASLIAPMQVFPDLSASGGATVGSSLDDSGSADLVFEAENPGRFAVWALIWAADDASNSFHVSLAGLDEVVFELPLSTNYVWAPVSGGGGVQRFFDLAADTHTFRFRAREGCTMLDKLVITDDLGFRPADPEGPPPDPRCD